MWGIGIYPAVFWIKTDRQQSACDRPLHLVSHFSQKIQKCWGNWWCWKLCKENIFTSLFAETGSHIRIQLLLIIFFVSLLSRLVYHMMDLNCQCTCYFALHGGSQQLCLQGQAPLLAVFLYCMYSKLAHLLWCYQIKPDCNACLEVTWWTRHHSAMQVMILFKLLKKKKTKPNKQTKKNHKKITPNQCTLMKPVCCTRVFAVGIVCFLLSV